jgi:co-chaperonin GroES (HSP10)
MTGLSTSDSSHGLPSDFANLKPLNDMILIERIDPAAKATVSAIQVASNMDDQRLLGMVVAVADATTVNSPISKVRVGDVVLVADAWGVGPKNVETGNRKFSFHKISNVVGIVKDRPPS